MIFRSEFVPVSDVEQLEFVTPFDVAEKNVPALAWNFPMPPNVDAERLVVNMSAIRRLNRVAGLCGGVVLGYDGETTEYTANIAGINPDGSAIATKAKVAKKADMAEGDLVEPYLGVPLVRLSTYGKPFAMHKLNKPEIVDRVTDSIREKSVTREQAWATELEKALVKSFDVNSRLNLGGKDILFKLQSKFDKVLFSAWGISTAYGMKNGLQTADLESAAIWAGFQAFFVAYASKINKDDSGSSLLSEKRWSLFYMNHQSDRILATRGLARASTLIKVLK